MEDSERGQGGSAGVWRAVDASANRAGEAIRVLEDVVRFVLDDAALTEVAKQLRHDLAAALGQAGLGGRSALRDVSGDVGATLEVAGSLARTTAVDLVAANAARAGQALRSLEECTAVVAPGAAASFERLRYRLYGLEQRALAVARARERLAGVALCVLLDGRADAVAFERLVASLFDAGVDMLQVRDKGLPMPELAERIGRAIALSRQTGRSRLPLVIVNDRPDVAVALAADGVHLGADDLPVPLARRVVGPHLLLGRTAHDLDEARAAVAAGADYLGVGPCYPSGTKDFPAFAPREFLRRVADEIPLPVFAIGGISAERIEELAALGIRRVAVGKAVTEAVDPARAVGDLRARLAASAG
jgi:thiamine-phosphate pyrophosphorylase